MIKFTSTQPNNSYFGIVLGSESMTNTDCIVFTAANSGLAVDYHSTDFGVAPKPDAQNDVTSSSVTNADGTLSITATRKWNTGDALDFVIPGTSKWELGYAFHGSYATRRGIQKHTNAGEIYIGNNAVMLALGASMYYLTSYLF